MSTFRRVRSTFCRRSTIEGKRECRIIFVATIMICIAILALIESHTNWQMPKLVLKITNL